jgi:MarR family 2-MHQ and catechol resistance regulon transcriptional repressor
MESSGTHLWLILMKAYDALRQHAERQVHALNLCLSDFAVLEVLLHKGPMPVNGIGARVRLTSGSSTVAVDRLAAKGLVERHNDPADRRARMVHLTEAGRELISRAFAAHQEAMEHATSGLNPQECEQAAALLKKLGIEAQRLLE